jgi:hypothetical protein
MTWRPMMSQQAMLTLEPRKVMYFIFCCYVAYIINLNLTEMHIELVDHAVNVMASDDSGPPQPKKKKSMPKQGASGKPVPKPRPKGQKGKGFIFILMIDCRSLTDTSRSQWHEYRQD